MSDLIGRKALETRLHAVGSTREIMRRLQIETIARAKVKVPRKTGHLGRSIVPGSVDPAGAWVKAKTPYAAAVELGSGIHGRRGRKYEIKPRKGKLLAWPASGGDRRLSGRARKNVKGGWVFARKVMHPGVRPRPYIVPAAKEAISEGPMRDLVVGLWNDAA